MNKITRSLIECWDTHSGFWSVNPQFKSTFSDFYKKDRSIGKKESSRTMWFVASFIDESSQMLNVPDKETLIGQNLFDDTGYYATHEEDILALAEKWRELSWSQAKRDMDKWHKRLVKRDDFLDTQDYSFDYFGPDGKIVKGTAVDLDRMAASTPKLWVDYFKIMEQLERENLDGESFGGSEDSFLDGGM